MPQCTPKHNNKKIFNLQKEWNVQLVHCSVFVHETAFSIPSLSFHFLYAQARDTEDNKLVRNWMFLWKLKA
jgi:hypothetical protein